MAASDGKDDSFVTVSVNSLLSPERPFNNTGEERFSLVSRPLYAVGCCQLRAVKPSPFIGMWYDMLYGMYKYVMDVVKCDV